MSIPRFESVPDYPPDSQCNISDECDNLVEYYVEDVGVVCLEDLQAAVVLGLELRNENAPDDIPQIDLYTRVWTLVTDDEG